MQTTQIGTFVVPQMQFKEAIDQFSSWRKFKVKGNTVQGYDRELRNFCLFMRNPKIDEVKLADVMEYLNGVIDLGWAHNSLMPRCMALRKFFEFMRLQGFSSLNEELIPIPHKIYNIPRVADLEHYKKLVEIVPKVTNDPRHIRNLAIINMLWDTGARNGEILSLNVSDIDTEQKKALIRTEKNKGSRPFREIFWTDITNENIKRWIKKREHLKRKMVFDDVEALFISAVSQRAGQRLTIKGVGEMLRRYANRAGMPYVNAHSFRHHMGHDIIKQGGSSADVMNILGHASVQSTTIYTMMTNKELESRYRSFKGN